MSNAQKATPDRESIYTLAQSGTGNSRKLGSNKAILVSGNGSDALNVEVLNNRSKRKHITQVLTRVISDFAKEDGNEELSRSLWNSYYCLNKLQLGNKRIFGKYCKNRICTVCLCIRKADIINRYLPILQKWEQPYFVTLTVRSVKAQCLKPVLQNMKEEFSKIVDKYKKQAQRGKGKRLIGIRSIECNFNPNKRTYNPHFHLIVSDKKTAEILRNEWLERGKKNGKVHWRAQHISKIGNREKCLIEVVKYGSKILTEQDVNKKIKGEGNRTIYAKALYIILAAMQGQRVFDRFGFNLPSSTGSKMTKKQVLRLYTEFLYDPGKVDWVEPNCGITLTDYSPEPRLMHILEDGINVEVA